MSLLLLSTMTLITGFACPPTIYFTFITKCDSFFYYKLRWSVITKCDSFFITNCDKCYYKVRQVLQSVTILLQSATGITKCEDYYKVRQYKPLEKFKHRYTSKCFQMLPLLCSLQLIFFSEGPFYGNYSTLDSHTNTVIISHAFTYLSGWRRKPWQGLFRCFSYKVWSNCVLFVYSDQISLTFWNRKHFRFNFSDVPGIFSSPRFCLSFRIR